MGDGTPTGLSKPPIIFPFVVGCPRSGTTLLRAMLDSHSELAIPPESYFVATYANQRRLFEANDGFDSDAFLEALCGNRWFVRWGLDSAGVRSAVQERHPTDTSAAVRMVYALYAASRGKRRYGDKTPEYVASIGSIAQILPEAKFLHLIRDGRDVAQSLLSAGMNFGLKDLGPALLFWERRVAAGRRQGIRLGPHRYRELRYEELIEDPESALRELSCFLQLDYQPGMLKYHERADEILKGVPGHEHHKHVREPPGTSARDWRHDLSPSDVQLAEVLIGSTLERFAYERTDAPWRAHMRADALRVRAEANLHRASNGVRARMSRLSTMPRLRKPVDRRLRQVGGAGTSGLQR